MKYKVVIPSAGLGTRLGNLSKGLNKALISIANKPAISYIIEKFPKEVEIIIALGYQRDTLKQFLELVYLDRAIQFVNIDKFDGDGAGLGYTLLQCRDQLQCPFIFCSNDTIVEEDIPEPSANWIGYSNVKDSNEYRTIKIKDNCVVELLEKQVPGIDLFPYIGLAGIRDYNLFWQIMEEGQNYGSISQGESYALKSLINDKIVESKIFTWYDIGNLHGLEVANQYFSVNSPNILPKTSEAIWFLDSNVIKYSTDTSFIQKRIKRAAKLEGFVPKVTGYRPNFYKYKKISGNTLSKVGNVPLFKRLIFFLKEFWQLEEYNINCVDFYKNKTYERVNAYFNRYPEQLNDNETINNILIPHLDVVLEKVDWDVICNGRICRFHGDLHFDNILLGEDNKFYLLDWRQDFNGNLEKGDIYYELAKLLHGMIIAHENVINNKFKIDINESNISFDISISFFQLECQKILEDFVIENNLEWKRVQIITALIFLNIAVLHHDPYSRFLFYLGKYFLWNLV